MCQEENNLQYPLGEVFYSIGFVSLSDEEYVLEDDDGKKYTIIRIADKPKPQETLAEG